MAGPLTHGNLPFEPLVSEANGYRSREKVTINASMTIVPGTVLVVNGAGYDRVTDLTAASAAAVAMEAVTTGAGETGEIVAIVRDAEVNEGLLDWNDVADPTDAGYDALEALGIIVRAHMAADLDSVPPAAP